MTATHNDAARLQRLREIAATVTCGDGVEPIRDLLAQDRAPTCPRFVAITEHGDGERRLRCSDDPDALTAHLALVAIADVPETIEGIVDLDDGTRHEASTRALVTFDPPLPAAGDPSPPGGNDGVTGYREWADFAAFLDASGRIDSASIQPREREAIIASYPFAGECSDTGRWFERLEDRLAAEGYALPAGE